LGFERDPDHLGALNNYSDLLFSESCFAAATTRIARAQPLGEPGSPLYSTIMATANEIKAANKSEGTGANCADLTSDQQQ
jgi:hypothetical protein